MSKSVFTNRRIIRITSLFFAFNILSVFLLIALNIYPYPAFFAEETGGNMDFYAICHFTLNKAENYSAFQDIYPPFGHFFCWLSTFFFWSLGVDLENSRYKFPDFIPFFLLVIVSFLSILFLFKKLLNRFYRGPGSPWFFAFSYLASSPTIYLLDRGNLLLLAQIGINLFFALLLSPPSRTKAFALLIAMGVPGAIKPYMLFPFFAFPLLSFIATISAIFLNLFSYLLWRPPSIDLWLRNVIGFASGSSNLPSERLLIGDLAAWTSHLSAARLLRDTFIMNGMDSFLSWLWYGLSVVSYLFFFFLAAILCLRFFRKNRLPLSAFFSIPYLTRYPLVCSNMFNRYQYFVLFLMTYTLLFGIMPVLTKSLYWYSLCFMFPVLLTSDILLYINAKRFRTAFVLIYQFTKILCLTTPILPGIASRDCFGYSTVIRNLRNIDEFIGLNFSLFPGYNLYDTKCFTSGFMQVSFFGLRTYLISLLTFLVIYILYATTNKYTFGRIRFALKNLGPASLGLV